MYIFVLTGAVDAGAPTREFLSAVLRFMKNQPIWIGPDESRLLCFRFEGNH